MSEKKLACSENEELFDDECADVADAIEIAVDNEWEQVYVGEIVPLKLSDVSPKLVTSDFWERVSERLWERCGEAADDGLSSKPITGADIAELENDIKAAVDAWADKHGQHPTCYAVENVKRYDVPNTTSD